jgi:hypothetical protein
MVLSHQRLVSISSSGSSFDGAAKKTGFVIGSLPLIPEYKNAFSISRQFWNSR